MSGKRWTKEEEEKLIKFFPNEKSESIAKMLNRTTKQVNCKANSLKIKKSKEHKGKMISNRNKIVGRDLNYENLKNIAFKYKTRGEFQRLDGSAYTTARVAGYLNDICSHMITSSFSIPQLILFCILKRLFNNDDITYNDKTVINPYELDVYIKKYKIGFEYDGKLWHINNELDIIKTELCKNKNVILIRFKENNRKYIQDIKNQLIENLNIINIICNTKIIKNDIQNMDDKLINDFVNSEIIDEKKIIEIINKYDNYHQFKINEISLYNKLIKRGLIDKYTSGLKRDTIYWNKEKILNEIKKYTNLGDFIKKSRSCYGYIKKNNLSHLIKDLNRKYKIITESEVIEEIKKYTLLKDFRENSNNYYRYVINNDLYSFNLHAILYSWLS